MADGDKDDLTNHWKVVAEPHQDQGETTQARNEGGLVVHLVHIDEDGDEDERHEISRVAWIRRNSKNPKVGFDRQLAKELSKAQKAADTLNNTQEFLDELRADNDPELA